MIRVWYDVVHFVKQLFRFVIIIIIYVKIKAKDKLMMNVFQKHSKILLLLYWSKEKPYLLKGEGDNKANKVFEHRNT